MQNRNQVTVHCIPYVTKCLYKVTLKEKKKTYILFLFQMMQPDLKLLMLVLGFDKTSSVLCIFGNNVFTFIILWINVQGIIVF